MQDEVKQIDYDNMIRNESQKYRNGDKNNKGKY